MDLDIRQYLTKAKEHQDCGALQSAYVLIEGATSAVSSGRTPRIDPEWCVLCAEAGLQLGCVEISTACLKMYFEGNPPANQFLCRAYLCQGQLKSPTATGSVKDFEEALMYFLKAIEISKREPRHHFMVFNASVLYFQTVRPLLQPGRSLHLVPSLRQVVQSLEEVADQDHSWRAELMMHLIKCLMDSRNVEDASSFAKVTEEFIKSHTPHLYPRLFTLLVQHQLSERGVLLETSRQSTALTVIYKMQELKKLEGLDKDKLTKENSAKLEEIFCLLVDRTKEPATPLNSRPLQSPAPIQPSDRVAFLLELALLALQVKHQKVAADCLKELKSSTEASVDQRIVMECVHCEINLLKKEAKMTEYSKASVEARLKEIRKLDQWLQTAVREGGPQAVQAVCATQWNFCLPLLQHNLRNRIKTPLLRVAQALEEMQSMLLELRCQVHSELAVTEEEKGRLEDSLTHLRKAMLLDNGTQQERLSSAFRLLKLRQTLYQTPSRVEDKAAMLMQQAKDMPPQNKTDFRPILVDVGIILAPDDFQLVLDADDTSKIPAGGLGSGPGARLAAKAQHHSASVQRVEGHMVRQRRDADHTEMMKLWATLAKTARKHEVWDVCRAACRFCLLYDDGRWQKTDTFSSSEGESCGSQSFVRLLRLLAEIHFISAEATIQKLREEGVQLNSPAVPPQGKWLCVSEEDPHWIIYRDWIQALCAYTTSSFLRAGELGAEIRESWVVVNAAIYLWNYNSHLLAAGEYIRLLPTFQSLVDMLQKTGYIGNRALFVLLCDAVAQGLIQPLSGLENIVPAPVEDKGKKRAEKGIAKAASAHGVFLDPAPLQDLHKALELCNDALHISNAAIPGETVPIAARKRVLATWVQINALLQQQIGSKIDKLKDESENEAMSAMTYVLAGVEMLQCNRNPRHMEFSVPNLSTLVSMAFQCRWSDAVVELQVWCQLAAFCHDVKDYSLVYSCTDRALQLEEAAAKTLNNMPCVLYGPTAVNEMLSIATCLRGLSLVHESSGDLDSYREAMKVLLSSLSYAEKAGSPALCVTAAKHYWNMCLPLTRSAEERRKLQKLLKMILNTLIPLATKQEEQQSKVKRPPILAKPPLGRLKHEATNEDILALKAAICCLWFQICIEEEDFERALQLLDKATRDMPHSRHRLPLLQYCVLVKARLGKNILLDIQKLEDEGEQCYSFLCHQAALCADAAAKQLTCYQKAITSLTSTETQWQKVNILLSFGQWLYSHNFNKEDAQQQIEWGVDILLHVEPEQAHGGADEPVERTLSPVKSEHLLGVQGLLFTQKVSSVKEMRRLDYLVQAHTLLAIMGDKTSPEHQLNLLRAYTFVLQMWQVSMAVACEISREMAKSEALHPPTSAESKKGKDRGKGKKEKEPIPAEERRKPVILDQTPPSTLRDWARFVCPDQARQIFRTSSNPHCINTLSITKQKQSLFYLSLLEKELHLLSLDHLTLPVMHLAETIAHDLLDSRSLSDLYRLRVVRTCVQLGLEAHSPYQKKLLTLSAVPEREQMGCHRAVVLSKERCSLRRACNQKGDMDESTLHIWLDKAEVCLSMGLYQSARQLLAEAHMVSMVLGDQNATSRSLLYLASLACKEQNHAQALILLDKAHALGGDEHFWYQFTLTKVTAVVGQRDKDSQTKVDHIIKQGCEALKLVLDQRVNRAPELTFLITSLEKRGALECIRAIGSGKPLVTLDSEAFQRLMAACDTLRECASGFTKFGYRQQAAEAHGECAQGLRILASHTPERESKQRFLLDGLSQMQLAVTVQEHVVLNAQSLLPPQEERHGPSLAATRRLLRLRLALAEFCLHILEERCAEETQQAVARQKKTSAEIALEEFSRCTPEPNSTEEEWMTVGITLQEIALGQLAAVSSRSLDNVETRACCLNLMGKYMRLVAVLEDPIYVYSLQKTNKQKEAWSDSKVVSMEEEDSEKDGRSSRKKLQMTSAKSSELQKSQKVQQLLAQATKPLAEATNLCLHHNVSPSILAGASLNMVECLGQSDPAVAGQYLALFQSCCTVAVIAEVLGSACADTSLSQLSALLSIRRNLLLSHEERPSSMIKGVEDSLSSLSKTFSHLTVNPSHLSILGELPPTLKILLLQHTEDGSELYGAFYEATKTQKGKTTQVTGSLMCTRVAKVSVCPQALLALREQTRAFCQETRHALLNKDSRHGAEDRLEASEEHPVFSHKSAREEELAGRFRDLVKDMEDYLNPLLTKFDFSCLRTNAGSLPVPETEKTKEKEERGSSGQVKMPTDPGEYVVVLADRNLLELPLESLSILQEEGLRSVTRDFSLQLLYSRLRKDKQKVESDNKKETKGGKGTKAKGDQSQAIKAAPASHVLPSNTFPLDTNNFKYLVDPYNEGHFGQTSLSMKMKEILETHSQHLTHPWEGFMGSKQIPSLSEMEQMLRRCSGFLYLGVEHFMANVPPAKLAALSLFECRLALLFDQGYNKTNVLHQSKPDMQQSAGTFALENPYETALLLSLSGVGCVVLNQWHSSFHQNIHNVTAVLDNMLRIRQTSGKAVHALRKGGNSEIPHHKVKGSHDQEHLSDLNEGKEDDDHGKMALAPSAFNCVLYGLPNLILM